MFISCFGSQQHSTICVSDGVYMMSLNVTSLLIDYTIVLHDNARQINVIVIPLTCNAVLLTIYVSQEIRSTIVD